MNRKLAIILLSTLAWSRLAFCGEIHDAAAAGNLEKVRALLKEDPNLVSSNDTNGRTPLFSATFEGHKDVVELLLANKADVNAKDDGGRTILHWLSGTHHADMVELLLTNNADVNARDNDGGTPLDWAVSNNENAKNGNTNVMKLLLVNKADVNATNKVNFGTPLHTAARFGNMGEVKLLLDYKPDLAAKDNYGRTPADLAEVYRHKDVAELLRQHENHE